MPDLPPEVHINILRLLIEDLSGTGIATAHRYAYRCAKPTPRPQNPNERVELGIVDFLQAEMKKNKHPMVLKVRIPGTGVPEPEPLAWWFTALLVIFPPLFIVIWMFWSYLLFVDKPEPGNFVLPFRNSSVVHIAINWGDGSTIDKIHCWSPGYAYHQFPIRTLSMDYTIRVWPEGDGVNRVWMDHLGWHNGNYEDFFEKKTLVVVLRYRNPHAGKSWHHQLGEPLRVRAHIQLTPQ
jgi:hypothetical protein